MTCFFADGLIRCHRLRCIGLFLCLVATSVFAQKRDTVIIQTSAHCMYCEKDIEQYLNKQKGVRKVQINPGTGLVKLVINPSRVHEDSIRVGLNKLGYDADQFKAKNRRERMKKVNCIEK